MNKLETRQMRKLVQHHQNISNSLREQLQVVAFFQTIVPDQSIKFIARSASSAMVISKKLCFNDFQEKNALNQKVLFFIFVHLK